MLNCWRQGVWTTDMPLYFEIFRQSGFGFVDVFQQMASGNTLLRNRGDGTFEDVTWQANANPPGWFWGASFADFDNDGWQDIYSADGWVYNDRGTEIELEFLNNVVSEQDEYKTGLFFDPKLLRHALVARLGAQPAPAEQRRRHVPRDRPRAPAPTCCSTAAASRSRTSGTAACSTSRSRRRPTGMRCCSNEVRPRAALAGGGAGRARKSNRDAVGARVTLAAGGTQQMREVVLGDGYGSQNTLRQHFGLGDAATVDELRVQVAAHRDGADVHERRRPTGSSQITEGQRRAGREALRGERRAR